MEIGIAILLFVCMTALLYVLLSLKITRQVDLQIKEFYKTRIHADMQEFYREMEGYAALFENRIQRFRALVDRNEEILRAADARATAPVAEPQAIAELTEAHGTAGFAAAWLRHRGLAWAADMLPAADPVPPAQLGQTKEMA